MLTLPQHQSVFHAEQGTTLIELLVAMLTAIVVVGALLAILEFSLTQEARISDKVQADKLGRLATTRIVEELHSACTGFGATAIQAPATVTSPLATTGPTDLWFLSAYGNASSGKAVPIPSEHDIHWGTPTRTSNTGETLGTITDYAFASTGGEAPKWEFPKLEVGKATTHVIASNVILPLVGAEKVKTLFQYYEYNESGVLTALSTPSAISTAASENDIAKVTINFSQAPEAGDTRLDRIVPFSDAVVLRFNPTESGSEANNEACL